MKYIITSLIIITIGIVAWFYRHPCIKEHQEWVHHGEWTELRFVGKVTVPITHPAKTNDTICDLRK